MIVGLRLIAVRSTCNLQGIVFIIRWFQNDFSLEMDLLYEEEEDD
jgi:hypothetical protein